MKNLASKFDQVINAIIVAAKNKDFIAAYKNDYNNLHRNFPLVIEILDGDFWEVCTFDENLINHIKEKYKDIDRNEVLKILEEGKGKAKELAEKKMAEVRERVGLLA